MPAAIRQVDLGPCRAIVLDRTARDRVIVLPGAGYSIQDSADHSLAVPGDLARSLAYLGRVVDQIGRFLTAVSP